jgi:hypothetical protein
MGRLAGTYIKLSTALELYHAMDVPFWLSQTEAALTQVDE